MFKNSLKLIRDSLVNIIMHIFEDSKHDTVLKTTLHLMLHFSLCLVVIFLFICVSWMVGILVGSAVYLLFSTVTGQSILLIMSMLFVTSYFIASWLHK